MFFLQSLPPAPVLLHFKLLPQLQATKSLFSTLQQLPILEPSSSPSQGHHAPAPPQRRWWHQYPSHSRMQLLSYRRVTLQTWQTWPAAPSHPCIQEEVLVLVFPFLPLPFTLLGVLTTRALLCPVLQCLSRPKHPTWHWTKMLSTLFLLLRHPLRHHQQNCKATEDYRRLWQRLGKVFRRCSP